MARVKGAELFVRALKKEGVKNIFTLSGGHIASIYNACRDHGIRLIDVRHEQAAAHAAAGWARITGEPGLCLVTAGPGVTDTVTGVAEAQMADCPMIVFGGRSPLFRNDTGPLQDLDQIAFMAPLTKWARAVYQADRLPEYVAMAFRKAKSPVPGPVYLESAVDVLDQEVDEEKVNFPENYFTRAEPYGDPALVRQAAGMLMSAERPVIIAGDGLFWTRGGEELKALAEYTSIPFWTWEFSRGIVPESHPLALGMAGAMMADVILALGVRFDFTLTYGKGPLISDTAKIIQVSPTAERIGYNRGADLGIVGGCRAVLEQLLEEIKENHPARKDFPWTAQVAAMAGAMAQTFTSSYFSDADPMHPARLAREVCEFIDSDPDSTVALDGGDSATWMLLCFKARRAGQLLSTGPFGCLGLGTGFALAAQVANPGKKVLLYSGDGSFGLNCMEFDTFLRHNLPVVAVISNDGAWGMVKQTQKTLFGEAGVLATNLTWGQRYDRVVEALGGHGEFVTRPEEVKPALERAFASGKPAVVNCMVDQVNFSPYTQMLMTF